MTTNRWRRWTGRPIVMSLAAVFIAAGVSAAAVGTINSPATVDERAVRVGYAIASSTVSWSGVEAGSGRQPAVVIDDGVYPRTGSDGEQAGVQFWLRGEVDDRCSCRPNGWDATGPREGSSFHVYPGTTLNVGDVIEARWVDRDGVSHSSQWVVGGSSPSPSPSPSPWNGSFPDASTTGLSDPGVLTSSGSVKVTQDGVVIENLDVRGMITIEANNVTIRNVRVTNTGGPYGIFANYRYSGTVIEDVELVGGGNSSAMGVAGSGFAVRRANVYGWLVGVNMKNDVVVEDSYFHDHAFHDGSHGEPILSNGGSGMVVRRNNLFIDTPGASASLALYGDFNPIHDVLVENNLFNGGAYCTFGGSVPGKPYPQATGVRYIDNRFGRVLHDACGIHGAYAYFDDGEPGSEWFGNVWHDSGEPIN